MYKSDQISKVFRYIQIGFMYCIFQYLHFDRSIAFFFESLNSFDLYINYCRTAQGAQLNTNMFVGAIVLCTFMLHASMYYNLQRSDVATRFINKNSIVMHLI